MLPLNTRILSPAPFSRNLPPSDCHQEQWTGSVYHGRWYCSSPSCRCDPGTGYSGHRCQLSSALCNHHGTIEELFLVFFARFILHVPLHTPLNGPVLRAVSVAMSQDTLPSLFPIPLLAKYYYRHCCITVAVIRQ